MPWRDFKAMSSQYRVRIEGGRSSLDDIPEILVFKRKWLGDWLFTTGLTLKWKCPDRIPWESAFSLQRKQAVNSCDQHEMIGPRVRVWHSL
jgi:hypothetical protein